MSVKVIVPYVYEQEIIDHKNTFWYLDTHYEQDIAGIGSDLMFQKMWKQFPNDDIFILHADMGHHDEKWFDKVLEYVDKHPEAGMFGCLLLYPAKNDKDQYYVQCAGGKFTNNKPDHFGSGLVLENKSQFKELEADTGQYDNVREVAWTTFGGCYLRRSFINSVGDFDASYEWTYNRDVDYCLEARKQGQIIYNIPVRLFHHESRDNKRLKDANKLLMETRNMKRLQTKWANSNFYKTLDRVIKNG